MFLSLIVLLGVGGQGLFAAPSDSVNIPDVNLKAALNSALGQGAGSDINEGQMASIITLSLNNTNIADLTGLEYATGIQYFTMNGNQVTDFTAIKSMTALKQLRLSGNNVTSSRFPDLSHLNSLILIDLAFANVDNAVLDKINKILSLTTICFQSNINITTIEPLEVLPKLKDIDVQFCGINDFRPINNMPLLTRLAAYGQNTGRLDPHTILDRTDLDYNEGAETLFLPFSMMPNVLTNFDGVQVRFTPFASPSYTYVGFNDVAVPEARLSIDSTGITISGVTLSEFQNLNELEYNAFYDNPAGSYATPPGFTFYAISSGTYDHYFDIVDRPFITATSPIYYWENQSVDESTFFVECRSSNQ